MNGFIVEGTILVGPFSWYETDLFFDLFIVCTLLTWLIWFLGLMIDLAIPDVEIHCWGCYFDQLMGTFRRPIHLVISSLSVLSYCSWFDFLNWWSILLFQMWWFIVEDANFGQLMGTFRWMIIWTISYLHCYAIVIYLTFRLLDCP
jgi:hypothetical protein